MRDDPKAVAQEFYKAMRGDTSVLDRVCSPSLKGHAGAGADLDQLKGSIESFTNSFPDLETDIRHLVREGDLISSWVTYEGTHKEEFAGVPASGRPVRFAAWDLFRIADGKIVELTQYCDLFTILNQIGALPTATPPAEYDGIEQPTG
jgi:steroid delta-isomerase-like uncharacterized protein